MRAPLLIALLFATMPASAEWGQFDHDFDENVKPWQEVLAQLPAYPKVEGLIPFVVSSATRNKHFVDFPSVSVGEDGVVRYSVVIRAEGGAENVSFEGMRCATGERKIYAFGRPNGEWARNRYARWEGIKDRQATSYHRELYYSYFCAGGMGEPNLKRVQWLLKSGGYQPPQ
jgi:hypothetical protein